MLASSETEPEEELLEVLPLLQGAVDCVILSGFTVLHDLALSSETQAQQTHNHLKKEVLEEDANCAVHNDVDPVPFALIPIPELLLEVMSKEEVEDVDPGRTTELFRAVEKKLIEATRPLP